MFTKDNYTGIPSRIVQAPTVALAMALALDRPRLSSCPRQARRRNDGQALPVEKIRNWSRQTYMHMNSYRYVCMYVCMYVCIYIYMYLFIFIYIYLCVCMHAHQSSPAVHCYTPLRRLPPATKRARACGAGAERPAFLKQRFGDLGVGTPGIPGVPTKRGNDQKGRGTQHEWTLCIKHYQAMITPPYTAGQLKAMNRQCMQHLFVRV